MTIIQLVEDLSEELKDVLSHMQFPDELTGKTTDINVFQFGIPREKTAEDKKKKFPYILIVPDEGGIEDSTSPQTVSIQILIGIYDKGLENQGKRQVLNVINDICERFLKNPAMKGWCYADEKITWVIDKEDEYPYHYGAVWMVFNTPAFRREDRFV
ncbi:hypothetical protein D3Z60_18265 [Lachnospiraceae bacterium]|jgi:hypothetical protein|nr:hypothetical protein [Lachnospiraceae bacterium]